MTEQTWSKWHGKSGFISSAKWQEGQSASLTKIGAVVATEAQYLDQ